MNYFRLNHVKFQNFQIHSVVRPAYHPATSANIPATTEDVSKQMIPDDDTIADTMMKETNCLHNTASNRVTWDGWIIDGAALVNILQRGKELKTFDRYY